MATGTVSTIFVFAGVSFFCLLVGGAFSFFELADFLESFPVDLDFAPLAVAFVALAPLAGFLSLDLPFASFLVLLAGVLLVALVGFLAESFFAGFLDEALSLVSLPLDLALSLSLESAVFFGYLASAAFLVALYLAISSL